MAISVRFPNGQSVVYNSATYVVWDGLGGAALYDRRDGNIVAKVLPGSGSIIEFTLPCRVSNPLTDKEEAIALVIKKIREVSDTSRLAELKRELRFFNAVTRTWES